MASSTIWPSANAQQVDRTRRVGVLYFAGGGQSALAEFLLVMRDGLKAQGWTEERNLQLDARIPNDAKAIDADADELVRLAPIAGCPSAPFVRSARIRLITSVVPPAGNGTIIVMGRD
jgi:hypothetical protein